MKAWFNSLVPRERIMVLAAAIVGVAALFFLLVWQPLVNANERLEQRLISAQEMNNWLADVAVEAEDLRRSGRKISLKGQNESLLSLVDQTSRAAGLGEAVRRIQPEGDNQTQVSLEQAGFNKMLFWLSDLEKSYGIRASALTLTRDEKPGQVQARLTLIRISG